MTVNPVSAGTSGAPDPATAFVSAMTPVRSVPVLVTVTDVTFPPDRSNADADHTRGPGDVSRSGGGVLRDDHGRAAHELGATPGVSPRDAPLPLHDLTGRRGDGVGTGEQLIRRQALGISLDLFGDRETPTSVPMPEPPPPA